MIAKIQNVAKYFQTDKPLIDSIHLFSLPLEIPFKWRGYLLPSFCGSTSYRYLSHFLTALINSVVTTVKGLSEGFFRGNQYKYSLI